MNTTPSNRRDFIKKSALGTSGLFALSMTNCSSTPVQTLEDNINFIGPKEGYTPQLGTLVSMMNWMRDVVLSPVRGMNVKDLDYIHDEDSNSIGSMLWHLAAVERFYQIDTFAGNGWGSLTKEEESKWQAASQLGDNGRARIKGYNLDFYLQLLKDVRKHTLDEFAKRDDDWLLAIDENWGWGPTNNYCKWFHVCEHESNHNGQIKYIKNRIS